MREAYRLNKFELLDELKSGSINIRILFSLSNKAYADHEKLKFAEISNDMFELLGIIKNNYPLQGKLHPVK
jgi:hypothetical protein